MGIDGNDIREGNKTLTLALVWQLMRAYTLSILKNLGDGHPVVEQEIIKWANEKVRRTRDEKKPTPSPCKGSRTTVFDTQSNSPFIINQLAIIDNL